MRKGKKNRNIFYMEDKWRKRIENNHLVEYIEFLTVRESKRDRQSKRGRERDSKVIESNSKKTNK